MRLGAIVFHMQQGEHGDLREIATGNLHAWKASGVVKTLKYYSAGDTGKFVRRAEQHHGTVVTIADGRIGGKLPPIDAMCEWAMPLLLQAVGCVVAVSERRAGFGDGYKEMG